MITYIDYTNTKPLNPQIGDLYIDKLTDKSLVFDGNLWVEVSNLPEAREQKLTRELKDLKDFMTYKGISMAEVEDFINSRRLVERMQE